MLWIFSIVNAAKRRQCAEKPYDAQKIKIFWLAFGALNL